MRRRSAMTVLFLALMLAARAGSSQEGQAGLADKSIFADTMVELSWVEVKESADAGAIVLLPIAVVEEHGPHLDLSPDVYLTVIYCRIMKRYLEEKGIQTLIAPPYYWGINGTSTFPGSFTVRPETFKALLMDTVESLKSWGFRRIFYVNLHGDSLHRSTITSSTEEVRDSLGIEVYEVHDLEADVAFPETPPNREGNFRPDYHAGARETADMYSFFPDKVRTHIAETLKPQSTFEPLGYVGDPASFRLEKGGVVLEIEAKYDAEKVAAYINKSDGKKTDG